MDSATPPWGTWHVLDDEPDFKVKRIEVLPGKRLSYQKHKRRSERWEIVRGEGTVILDGTPHSVKAGQGISIPRGALHRMENRSSNPLLFIEVQRGDYFGEDDIVRIDDDYGRE